MGKLLYLGMTSHCERIKLLNPNLPLFVTESKYIYNYETRVFLFFKTFTCLGISGLERRNFQIS